MDITILGKIIFEYLLSQEPTNAFKMISRAISESAYQERNSHEFFRGENIVQDLIRNHEEEFMEFISMMEKKYRDPYNETFDKAMEKIQSSKFVYRKYQTITRQLAMGKDLDGTCDDCKDLVQG